MSILFVQLDAVPLSPPEGLGKLVVAGASRSSRFSSRGRHPALLGEHSGCPRRVLWAWAERRTQFSRDGRRMGRFLWDRVTENFVGPTGPAPRRRFLRRRGALRAQ